MEAGDGAIWPIRIFEGGDSYSFCPGKATWDDLAKQLFSVMMICAETGQMWEAGGLRDQPDWFIDLLAWFLPRYDTMKFISKADMILGGGKGKTKRNLPGPARMTAKRK